MGHPKERIEERLRQRFQNSFGHPKMSFQVDLVELSLIK